MLIKRYLRNVLARFPALESTYRDLRDQRDYGRPSIEAPWGFFLAGHEKMANGEFEPEVTEIFRGLLQEVDLFVNIGANIGYYCCHALSFGKSVIAIEPVNRNVRYLTKNIRINGWKKNAEIYPVAVGATTDISEIWGGGTGASLVKGWAGTPETYVTHVPVLTLDTILANRVHDKKTLILADLEGAEYSMLQGATNTLRSLPRPTWILEVSCADHQPKGVERNPRFIDTFEVFFECGYRAFTADAARREVTKGDVRMMAAGAMESFAQNYIFIPK